MPAQAQRFFLLPGEVYCPLLLYLAVSLTFFEARDSVVASVVALSILATMITGNVVTFDSRHTAVPQLIGNMMDFHRVYGLFVAVQTLAILGLLGRASRQNAQDTRRGGRLSRTAVVGGCLVLVGLLVVLMYAGAYQFQRRFQYAMASFLQRYAREHSSRTIFDRQVDLWRTAGFRAANDQTVVLRVAASRTPGYLRGYTYNSYGFGRWTTTQSYDSLLPVGQAEGHITFRTYERFPDPAADERLDILPAPGFRSQVLLLPGEASRIEIIAGSLTLSPDGEVGVNDWERTTGYVVVAPQVPEETAYPGPAGDTWNRDDYLEVPGYLRPALTRIAEEAFADLPEDASAETTIHVLRDYLQRTCTYDLGVQMSIDGGDPVIQFLTQWHRGHCELFAASATLLLRLRGIPARYITGFVCTERPPGARHYVARRANAHAWAEAYNEATGRWELVETTPGDGIPDATSQSNLAGSLLDTMRLAWQRMLAMMKRGYIAQAITSLFMALVACVVTLLASPLRATILLALLAVCFYWLHRRRRQRKQRLIQEVGARRWLLRQSHRRFLKAFRKHGIDASPADTLRNLLTRLAGADPDYAACLAPVVDEYERLRFGSCQPSAQEVRQFERRLRKTLRQRTRDS
jgi:transglutaminase-like putative cysteine protease